MAKYELTIPNKIGIFELNTNINDLKNATLKKLKKYDYEDFFTYNIDHTFNKLFVKNDIIKAIQIGYKDELIYNGINLINQDLQVILDIFKGYGEFKIVNDVYHNDLINMTLYVVEDNKVRWITISCWDN